MRKYARQEKSQRKHPVISSARSPIKAPVVPTAPKERPGWKGPGSVKRIPRQSQHPRHLSTARGTSAVQEQHLPLALQQLLLNALRTSFPVCQEHETLKPMLQEIRLALSEGDTNTAFSRLDWMEAYAVRWSSIRALCYATVLVGLFNDFREHNWVQNLLENGRTIESPSSVVCFGGGPTELLAFAAASRHIRQPLTVVRNSSIVQPQTSGLSGVLNPLSPVLRLHLVDKADWAPVVSCLETALLSPPMVSNYASQSARLKNTPFVRPGDLSTSFLCSDVLTASEDGLVATIGPTPSLITFFFTLGYLLASSTAKTAALLLKLTLVAPKDSLLLIIDSPEPAPEAEHAERAQTRYRMDNWRDLVLMEKAASPGVAGKPGWEELLRDENRLFKLEEGLKFPISLDHVKFQIHLFRKQ